MGQVIQFPTTAAKAPEGTPAPEVNQVPAPAAPQEMVMRLIDQNRRKGLVTLGEKMETLTKRENVSDGVLENTLRDIQGALSGILTHLEATGSLTEYLKHDLIACIENLDKHGAQALQLSGYVRAMISLLVEKGVITHEEMAATWDKIVRPDLEALRDQINKGVPEEVKT